MTQRCGQPLLRFLWPHVPGALRPAYADNTPGRFFQTAAKQNDQEQIHYTDAGKLQQMAPICGLYIINLVHLTVFKVNCITTWRFSEIFLQPIAVHKHSDIITLIINYIICKPLYLSKSPRYGNDLLIVSHKQLAKVTDDVVISSFVIFHINLIVWKHLNHITWNVDITKLYRQMEKSMNDNDTPVVGYKFRHKQLVFWHW